MDIRLRHRRECGNSTAVDVYLPRPLDQSEFIQLAEVCHGLYRSFGSLIWIDLCGGRMTASINSPRLTLRFKDPESETSIVDHLTTLDTPGTPGS